MDIFGPQSLNVILQEEELKLVPDNIQQKLATYLEQFTAEYCKQRADAHRLNEAEQSNEALQNENQDYQVKFGNFEKCVAELRSQRDSHIMVIKRQLNEIELLKQDWHTSQQQLKSAISAKCEAIARLDEIQSKEITLELKERRLESERSMMQNEIQLLTNDINRTNAELENIRRENSYNSMHLEVRLKEKIDELQIVQGQNAQYTKTIEELNKKTAELAETMYVNNKGAEEYAHILKDEIDAKDKLNEVYRTARINSESECNELLAGFQDLRRMLDETTVRYSELETKFLDEKESRAEEVAKLNNVIENLKIELVHANDLIKEVQEQSLESAIYKLALSASVAKTLMRGDMTITEVFSSYVQASEELEVQKRTNSQLNLEMKAIVEEISERAPFFEKQGADYNKLLEAHDMLINQRDELAQQKLMLEHELEKAEFDCAQISKENKKLNQTRADLGRQVSRLLDEINCLRAGVEPVHNQTFNGPILNSSDAISKDLVTFTSITEMQEKNEKLLVLIRELLADIEEREKENVDRNVQGQAEQLEKLKKKQADMEEDLTQKTNTISTLLAKCERYKKFYNKQETKEKLERKIQSLQQQLDEEAKRYASLKESHEYYISEKRNNDSMMQKQFDAMRKEVRELTSLNCKYVNANEFQKEQTELMQKSIVSFKQQISALEDRTKNYEKTIIKHEQTVHMLKDEVMSANRKQASADSEANQLRHENRILKDTSSRLQVEKEGYYREHQNQSLLLNNLELIMVNLERSETEGRLRVEQRLDDTIRELSAQRRHFQEEEEKFRETVNEFKRQTETAKKHMEEEKQQAEKLRSELMSVREELAAKINQVNDLSVKLQESLTPSKNENPITAANKKAREFELKYEKAAIEIESLRKELAKSREHEQFYKMSQNAETEIKRLHDIHSEIVAKSTEEIKQLKKAEAELKTRVTDLEAKVLLSNVTEQSKGSNQSDQLKLAQEELRNTLEKLTESGRTIRELRSENSSLADALNAVEAKCANEMILHSADIQELTKIKAEFIKVNDEFNKLNCGREALQAAHDDLQRANSEFQKLLQNEKEESDKRIADLNALNSNLHDQIEALTRKLAALTQSAPNQSHSFSCQNESTADTSMTDLNTSISGEENKNNEQLLQIIKFLRREKDISTTKLDIVKAENARLVSEHTMLQKKVDELSGYLKQERSKTETEVVSAAKHEEVLRKIETLNAMTNSNRILREERNALTNCVVELTERVSSVKKELFPLQCSNKELTSKIEEVNAENTSLRTEAIKWRQRANALVEKSNRNPEEFKRLQAEREHLAKLLTAEKETMKKLSDENASLKSRLENELPILNKHLQALGEDRKRLNEEVILLKQSNARLTQEIMELKNRLLQKEEEMLKANEDIELKDKQIQEKDTKELQLCKLAKRYKDFYTNSQAQGGAEAAAESQRLRGELDELNNTLRSQKEEYEKLCKEYEDYKSRSASETDTTVVLRESKQKIDKLVHELTISKTELANQESTLAGTKTSYEETIARLEKELQENITANKDITARLTRENESLHMRINQLTRQLGSQQSAKPSTSSVGITEKGNISESSPRTANVKPMSDSATVQQSATVTPWRGGETPLASIRPISVQNSRTAAILPTSQQPSAGSASTSSTSTSTASAAATGSSSTGGNTALVPPQQQVHTTGSGTLESMASSSPTSSHTDYMPSTSSAAVAVAAIPPMEAESLQHPQQNDTQLFVGGAQQQVVALVSPRVEGSSSSSTQNPAAPGVQVSQDTNNQQPSTSGTSSSSSTVVSSHSRHAPSSSNVTTTQAGCSSLGIKRPRDVEGDSSTNAEDGENGKMTKRMRAPMHSGELSAGHIGDSGMDVDQMPTSSQRDQEDDIVVVDSDEEEDVLADADDGPIDGGDGEQEGYENSYEQDNEMDDNEGVDDEQSMPADAQDNNEVDIDEMPEQQLQVQDGSLLQGSATRASTQENNQQSQAISSGSGETSTGNMQQADATWKQAPSTSSAAGRRTDSSVEIVSSPQVSNFGFGDQPARVDTEVDGTINSEDAVDESAGTSMECTADNSAQKTNEDESRSVDQNKNTDENESADTENVSEADEAFAKETSASTGEDAQLLGNEHQNVGTSQSDLPDNQANQGEGGPSEENKGTDGVSSE